MKRMTVEEFTGSVDRFSQTSPNQQILLTRRGKPLALVRSVKGLDEEQIRDISDPKFWDMIAARRREPTVPLEVVEAKLREDERRERMKKKVRKGK
jgi:hypothetical protein